MFFLPCTLFFTYLQNKKKLQTIYLLINIIISNAYLLFMKKSLLLAIVITFSVLNVFSQEFLPKGLTEKEKESYYDFIHNTERPKSTTPPAVAPRTPAEWEEAQGVIVTWAAFNAELREIVRRAKEAATVYIICSNPTTVQNYLTSGGVSLTNIVFVTAPFNSVWVRDYGPQSVYLENGDLAFIDWLYNRPRPQDNAIPQYMANYLGLPFYQMGGSSGQLITTGGNFMADGHDDGYSSKLVLVENPSYNETQIDQIKHSFMGINPYIKMEELPYDYISHIDMHMKLLDEETLLVGQFPAGVSDGPYIEANLQYLLDNYKTKFGNDFKVIRIPMVPSTTGQWPLGNNVPYRTYTNALILNNIVLVPQYYNATLNAQAIAIYQDAMPGYEVYGINMENVIPYSGAIHCITREIAASDPVHISHAKIRSAMSNEPYYTVNATINSPSGLSGATVYWTTNPGSGFNSITMTNTDDYYSANIPAQPYNTSVSYYISATNNNSKTISKPLVAPAGYYTFIIGAPNGDVNGDGYVNVLDVVWMVSHLTGSTPVGFILENADVNQDGSINIADLTALINLILS
jgi:agmatine deiminase